MRKSITVAGVLTALFAVVTAFAVLGLFAAESPSLRRFHDDNAMGATANAAERIARAVTGLTCFVSFGVFALFWVVSLLDTINAQLKEVAKGVFDMAERADKQPSHSPTALPPVMPAAAVAEWLKPQPAPQPVAPSAPAATEPTPTPVATATREAKPGDWFVKTGNTIDGPFTAEEMKRKAAARELNPSTLCRPHGRDDWFQASNVKGLF